MSDAVSMKNASARKRSTGSKNLLLLGGVLTFKGYWKA
jgi:hypothetical protein